VTLSPGLERLVLDIRHSFRVLRRAPVFTVVAILSLALGIGANTAIFGIVHAFMLRALPVPEPERLVQVAITPTRASFTNPIWEAIRDQQRIFEGMFAFSRTRLDRSAGGERQYVEGLYVSGDFFTALGLQPFSGRLIGRDDDQRGGGRDGLVAVLSHEYWRRAYGGSPSAVGSTIRLDGHPFTIVGVTGPGFFGVTVGNRFDVAVPLGTEQLLRGTDSLLDKRGNWWLTIMGRLAPGEPAARAEARLRALIPHVRTQTMPEHYTGAARDQYLADPLVLTPASTGASTLRTRYKAALFTLMGTVALVLLIACANLANLLLARASARQKEFAVCVALGATRLQLVRRLLTESLLLSAAGAAAGLLFASWASRFVVQQLSSARSPLFLDVSLDGTVLAFTAAAAILTTCIVGLAPAFRSTQLQANALIRGSSRSVSAGGWRGLSAEKMLLIVQIAFSLTLVFGALLFVRTFTTLATTDMGFEDQRVIVVSVDARRAAYAPDQRQGAAQRILDAVRTLPQTRSSASTIVIPITNNTWTAAAQVRDEGRQTQRQERVFMNRVSPDYFKTLSTPLLAGREFSNQDVFDGRPVAIVNRAFARKFLGGANPVGRTFEISEVETGPVEIVGLVEDSKYLDVRQAAPETVFLPTAQDAEPSNYMTFLLRTSADTPALRAQVTDEIRRVHPNLGVEFRAFDAIVSESLMQERLVAILSAFLAVLALVVAAIGLYGVMSLNVSRRRNEIGIRMALGAQPEAVVWMVLRDVTFVTAIGLAMGALTGVWSGRLVGTLLYGLTPGDIPTWLLAMFALAISAGIAGYLPARRAAHVNPISALRGE
jgi:putative ABC transport system permease protein